MCLCRIVGRALLIVSLLAVGAGCATSEQRADRALEQGDHVSALALYEEEIDRGSRDPELYFKAAQAAIKNGNLSLAERHYSQSLRYGGGERVARSLARYYLSTSNYASAVRVLQRLLDEVEDPQPVYNNLGTALMYSGMPLDAESYLLISQQMQPSDPLPYLNLGLLYDEHFNNPRLARGFYECYVELGEGLKQVDKVRLRISEIRRRWGVSAPQFRVECGEPYRSRVAADSSSKLDKLKADQEAPSEPGAGAIDLGVAGGQGETASGPPTIEKQVEAPTAEQADADAERSRKTLELLERAERAFASERFDVVVQAFADLPVDALNPRNAAMYGLALAKVGRQADAVPWLALSMQRRPTSSTLSALLDLYGELGDEEQLRRICDVYRENPNLQDVIKDRCPEPSDEGEGEEELKPLLKPQAPLAP